MSADSKVWLSAQIRIQILARKAHLFPITVTGSSQGLGKSVLETILEKGDRVVATLRKPEVLNKLREKYSTTQLLILPLDVTNKSQIDAVFEETKKHFDRLDVVVNNAGYGLSGEIETMPEEAARKQIEVLFWGPVRICQRVGAFFDLRYMF